MSLFLARGEEEELGYDMFYDIVDLFFFFFFFFFLFFSFRFCFLLLFFCF